MCEMECQMSTWKSDVNKFAKDLSYLGKSYVNVLRKLSGILKILGLGSLCCYQFRKSAQFFTSLH